MMHMDIGTTNAVIAARQEHVARMIREGQRPGVVMIAFGSLLVRLGEWLRGDTTLPMPVERPVQARRPQMA